MSTVRSPPIEIPVEDPGVQTRRIVKYWACCKPHKMFEKKTQQKWELRCSACGHTRCKDCKVRNPYGEYIGSCGFNGCLDGGGCNGVLFTHEPVDLWPPGITVSKVISLRGPKKHAANKSWRVGHIPSAWGSSTLRDVSMEWR